MPHSGILLEDIYVENEVDKLFFANGPIADLTAKNTDFDTAKLVLTGYPRYDGEEFTDLTYPECDLRLSGCTLGEQTLVVNLPPPQKSRWGKEQKRAGLQGITSLCVCPFLRDFSKIREGQSSKRGKGLTASR